MDSPIERAFGAVDGLGLDALLISGRENCRYLSGFTGSEATLLLTRDDGEGRLLFTDSRYVEQASNEVKEFQVIEYRKIVDEIAGKIKELKLKKVGFESRVLSYSLYNRYLEAIDSAVLVPVERALNQIRVVKQEDEIKLVRKAIDIAEKAYRAVREELVPGAKERDIAIQLEYEMKRLGSGTIPFEVIVTSGARAALPHGRASNKAIRKGEMVIIDFGASWEGYNSDETVTLSIGKAKGKLLQVYKVVKDAHDAAIDKMQPGMALRDADAIARKIIEKKGFGKFFGHGLGHGVGLHVHEEPAISPLSEGILPSGCVVTVEPGIYIPGVGGVRIEDMVRVTDNGTELLTSIPKDLTII